MLTRKNTHTKTKLQNEMQKKPANFEQH